MRFDLFLAIAVQLQNPVTYRVLTPHRLEAGNRKRRFQLALIHGRYRTRTYDLTGVIRAL